MKYLEEGSTGTAEQEGQKAEATEAMMSQRHDEQRADLRPPMRVSDEQQRSGLGRSPTSEL